MIKITLIEDDAIIRRNLKLYIEFQDDMQVVSVHESVEDFLKQHQKADLNPEVLILDIGLPGISGLDGIELVKKIYADIDIIMLTTYDDEDKIIKALSSGACSYLSKKTPLEQIMNSIRIVVDGGSYMSPSIARKLSLHLFNKKHKPSAQRLSSKQEEVMKGLVDGLSYKELASKMEISIDTVRTHIKRIYTVLHVNSKAGAVSKYLKGL